MRTIARIAVVFSLLAVIRSAQGDVGGCQNLDIDLTSADAAARSLTWSTPEDVTEYRDRLVTPWRFSALDKK